mmetsp:Transcript_21855/g.37668  ORF Transcript_21855/g.37668 Transcript_21855/m.37668 type:complete len:414 (+) Transcript_21855:182-1423(+)|eukprot:CAMPEP_0184695360 /NCGR_PEP_ID=MMETSP0313-20130426/3013_1 /TAXON_ID=2792 /ORGANISM="Porphyridium aerugineum, Strain SAG 1380-2" /LENGTH=413 /DNA_ID=CAMNT_0027153795 /DNA_START=140 /DNA_END=1381 /DNA_ORIENTATION=-
MEHDIFDRLMQYILQGDVDGVRECIERGVNINDKSADGFTPLLVAAKSGFSEICRVLIQNGAKLDEKSSVDGNTALHYASRNGHFPVAKLLVEAKAPLEVRNDQGNTPLKEFAPGSQTDIMEMLIQAGADLEARDLKGQTPLIGASGLGKISAVRTLLENRARLNEKDNSENTPLMKAAFFGHASVCKMLLDFGADVHVEDSHGKTAMDLALRKRQHKVIEVLSEYGGDRRPRGGGSAPRGGESYRGRAGGGQFRDDHDRSEPRYYDRGDRDRDRDFYRGAGNLAGRLDSGGAGGVGASAGAAGGSPFYRGGRSGPPPQDYPSNRKRGRDDYDTPMENISALEKKRWYNEKFQDTVNSFGCEELTIKEAAILASSLLSKDIHTCTLAMNQSDKDQSGFIDRMKFRIALDELDN